ncbi:hypothetical protein DFQ28_003362 [Apophysomyces sp. BC1034]|nr:hypothetical protein DFQ30_005584 [Apophysomyces sp. BC1015]KAG0189474.1 hypothetical protein DFQ28_003362 [Apophysomyces sp. BC1034]
MIPGGSRAPAVDVAPIHGEPDEASRTRERTRQTAAVRQRYRAATTMSELTHFDASGQAHMVDVGDKDTTRRVAIARGTITLRAGTLARIRAGRAAKGDVLGVARIAAIQGAKRTSELIPLCHPLALTRVTVDFTVDETPAAVHCTAHVETIGRTGVEMEALTAVQVGLLTVYDMCKTVDRGMTITDVKLIEKHGGKSGDWVAGE